MTQTNAVEKTVEETMQDQITHKQVHTDAGTLTAKTVPCSSCGQRTILDELNSFSVGGQRKGVICEYCDDEGPISIPERILEYSLPQPHRSLDILGSQSTFLIQLVLFPILGPIAVGGSLVDDAQFRNGYANATVAALVWTLLIGGIQILFGVF